MRAFLLNGLVLLLLAAPAAAQTASITGRVTDAATGAPIPAGSFGARPFAVLRDASASFVVSVVADATGAYSFTGLAPGAYYVSSQNSLGYVDKTSDGMNCVGGCGATHPVILAAGQTLTIDFALDASAVITGTVRDRTTRAPLAGAGVSIYDVGEHLITTGGTDSTGVYRIGGTNVGLAGSTYYVVAEYGASFIHPGPSYAGQAFSGVTCSLSCRLKDATPVRAGTAQTVTGIDFLLDQYGAITGRVGDATTLAPLAQVTVLAEDPSGTIALQAVTGPDGRFTFADVPPGTWNVRTATVPPGFGLQAFDGVSIPRCADIFTSVACRADRRSSTPVVVATGSTTGGVDFRLRRGGSLAGNLKRGGQPFAGEVTIYDAAGVVVQTAPSGTGGDYLVEGLVAGRYFVRGGQPSFHGLAGVGGAGRLYASVPCDYNLCAPTTGTPVAVADGARTSGIDIDVPVAGSIAGTVRSASGPLAFVSIQLMAGDQAVASALVNTGSSSGTYSFADVAPGVYQVRASGSGFLAEWFDNVCATCGPRGTPVVVTAGAATPGIDFDLDPAGKISGVITLDTPTRSVVGVFIEALRADGSLAASTFRGTNGEYTIDGLPSGSYYVRAGSRREFVSRPFPLQGGEFAPELYKDVDCDGDPCPLTSATPVVVTAGATTSGIDLTLNAGAFIDGRVVVEGNVLARGFSPGLAPLSGTVQAFTADGRRAGNSYSPGGSFPNERYGISGLRPGRYFLQASTGVGGYAPVIYKDLTCPACTPASGTPVTLAGVEFRTGIDFTLLPGGSVSGTVRDDAVGTPISGVTVSAYAANGLLVASGLTNASGSYQLDGLGGGQYFLGTSNVIGYTDEVSENVPCGTCDPARGRAVEVQGGGTTAGVDFALTRGVLLSGQIRDAAGTGAGPGTVSIFNAAGVIVARAQANAAGGFAVSTPPGTNYARLEPRATVAARLYDGRACPGGACDPTTGTAIAGVAGQTIRGIDFNAPICAPVSIAQTSLPAAIAGAAYATALTASPGGPFTYALQAGTLPPGVTVGGTGSIAGTPSAPGRYTFTVGAADAAGCGSSRAYTIEVTGCTPSLPVPSVGSPTFDIRGSGGLASVTIDTACPAAVAFNASWLSRNRDLGPGYLEIAVAPNPGGRRTGTVTIGNRTITINQAPVSTAVPFGALDVPADGSIVTGSVATGGWVLDDLRVLNVSLFRSPVAGEPSGGVFIGTATLVPGARPDVESVYPEFPYANRAGWGYLLLTNVLPNQGNGTFTITAIAEDAENNKVNLGSRTIVANNATATQPFGAIDTPQQGETIAGASFVNFGWALTPKPKTIPRDGSTISVVIDGAVVGTVTYDNFRQDIASLFPGLNNTSGAVGYRMIDTTTLADGLHTIAWVVTDDSGAAEGIGSRYFTVANGTSQFVSGLLTPPSLQAAPLRGVARQVEARALEHIEIDLADGAPASCRAVFSGVERVGADLRPLPIGSSLDRERGVFRWQPGPGFVGSYNLSFDVGQCDGAVARVDAVVRITMK